MPAIFQRRPGWLAAAVFASLGLGACGGVVQSLTPYRAEVVQGNFVSREQVEALKPGMTRQQVREILGTSLLADVFHADRWDYVFTIRRQGIEPQQRHLTVHFNGDLLDRFEGDTMPSEEEFVARLDIRRRGDGKVPALEATPEQLNKYKSQPSASIAPATAPLPLPASYPPLESR
jgi:outer membrane protein assembly factor BamE